MINTLEDVNEFIEEKYNFVRFYVLYPFNKIIRILSYIPYIWKQEEYSCDSMLGLMQIRLKRHRDYLIYNSYLDSGEMVDIAKINQCLILMDRIMADKYFEEEYDLMTKEYGECIYDMIPVEENMNDQEVFTMKRTWPKELPSAEAKVRDYQYNGLVKRSDKRKKADLELLFKILSKNMLNWWL